MEDDNKKNKLVKEVKEIIKSTPIGEHVFNIFRAALASVPIGASFASLLKDYIPDARFKRIDGFARQVAEDLKRLSDKIDADYITKDEFAYMFEQSFRGVAQNYQEEKIDAFRAILLNSAIRKDVLQEEKEFFLSMVNNFSVVHIRILKFLAKPEVYISEQGIIRDSIQGGFRDIFRTLMPEVDAMIVESAFSDLFQLGLINTDKTIFHTMTSGSGLQLVGDGRRVHDLGRRFIEFCISP